MNHIEFGAQVTNIWKQNLIIDKAVSNAIAYTDIAVDRIVTKGRTIDAEMDVYCELNAA